LDGPDLDSDTQKSDVFVIPQYPGTCFHSEFTQPLPGEIVDSDTTDTSMSDFSQPLPGEIVTSGESSDDTMSEISSERSRKLSYRN